MPSVTVEIIPQTTRFEVTEAYNGPKFVVNDKFRENIAVDSHAVSVMLTMFPTIFTPPQERIEIYIEETPLPTRKNHTVNDYRAVYRFRSGEIHIFPDVLLEEYEIAAPRVRAERERLLAMSQAELPDRKVLRRHQKEYIHIAGFPQKGATEAEDWENKEILLNDVLFYLLYQTSHHKVAAAKDELVLGGALLLIAAFGVYIAPQSVVALIFSAMAGYDIRSIQHRINQLFRSKEAKAYIRAKKAWDTTGQKLITLSPSAINTN